MTPLERATEILASARALVEDIRLGESTMTLADSKRLHSEIVECRGWLESALVLLTPGAVL